MNFKLVTCFLFLVCVPLFATSVAQQLSEKTGHQIASKANEGNDGLFNITTAKGMVYKNCRIRRIESDGISITHSGGISSIPFVELPEEYSARVDDARKADIAKSANFGQSGYTSTAAYNSGPTVSYVERYVTERCSYCNGRGFTYGRFRRANGDAFHIPCKACRNSGVVRKTVTTPVYGLSRTTNPSAFDQASRQSIPSATGTAPLNTAPPAVFDPKNPHSVRGGDGATPLHIAAAKGDADAVRTLLNDGANVNAQIYRRKDTPLHMAVDSGSSEVVSMLLVKGAQVNATDENGYTALMLSPSSRIVELLIKAGANVNARGNDGYTPLHFASDPESKQLLLDAGANPNARSNDGLTPSDLKRESDNLIISEQMEEIYRLMRKSR